LRASRKGDLRGTGAILIVEDQEDVRTLAVVALHRYGYTVYSAANASEARAFVHSHEGPLALLLTDVIMPGGNGPELAAELRGVRPELKVLFMSGYTDNAIALNRMLETGVNYLQKPFTADTLAGKVAEVLGS
jgi:DNA-binding NtrC family response regulator